MRIEFLIVFKFMSHQNKKIKIKGEKDAVIRIRILVR